MTLGSNHPLTEMSTRNISWKGGCRGDRCVGLITSPTSYVDCLEIWEPQPRGTLRASPGLYKDCITFTFTSSKTQGLRDRLGLCAILAIILHKYFHALLSLLKQKQFYTFMHTFPLHSIYKCLSVCLFIYLCVFCQAASLSVKIIRFLQFCG